MRLEELANALADPDVPEESLRPYLVAVPSPRGMGPILLPNPATVESDGDPLRVRADLGLGFLNAPFRLRRQRIFERRLAANDPRPILLAEGDSWFQYPIWLDDIVDQLMGDYTICCLSAAGDTLDNMLVRRPEYLTWLDRLIGQQGRTLDALLISAGGNDLVGGQLAGMMKPFEAGRTADWYVDNPNYSRREAEIRSGYRGMIQAVRARWPDLPVVVHGYDHALPRPPQGIHIPPLDGWLGAPFRGIGIVDGALQAAIVVVMIDRLNAILAGLANDFPDVRYVDLRRVIGADWHDELHPNNAGFARVAGRIREHL
jgi:lysophospholipase L1-like esterase